MTHASRELLRALRGIAPSSKPKPEDFVAGRCEAGDLDARISLGCLGLPRRRDTADDAAWPVDCPRCAKRVREAINSTDPVRWDYLAERGLVSLGAPS